MKNRINHGSLAGALKLASIILATFILLTACAADTDVPAASLEGEVVQEEAAAVQENPVTEAAKEPSPQPIEANEDTAEPTEAPPETLVLHNGLLITATGEEPIPDGVVVIEGGLIKAVGPKDSVAIPKDATVIDANGGAIMPGLIDARAGGLLNRLELQDGQINPVALEMYLSKTLRSGLTTVRTAGWDWEEQMQNIGALRAALQSLGNTIPTIVISSTSLAHGEGSAVTNYPDNTIGVVNAEEARQVTEQLLELGVDQISILQSPEMDASDLPDVMPPTLSSEQIEAIVTVAHNQGKWVLTQAGFADEAAVALAGGVDELANWPSTTESMPDDLIEALVADSIPVVSGFNVYVPQEGDVRRFLDAGGTLAFGTFAPESHPLSDPYFEFLTMSIHEMTPMEIITSVTANAAEVVGLGDEVGTLEVGKRADIIVVDGNPLEDLRGFRDGIVVVIKGGELVPLDS